MKKRWIALLLIALLVLIMVTGCTGHTDEDDFSVAIDEEVKKEDPSKEEKNAEDEKQEDEPKVEFAEGEKSEQEMPAEDEKQEIKPAEEVDFCGFPLPDKNTDYSAGYLKVMSYNIKHLGSDSDKLDELAAYIKEADPDILGLQEVDDNTGRNGKVSLAKIAETLGYEYYHMAPNIDYDGGTYGNALLSKYPITDSEAVDFYMIAMNDHNRSYCRYEIDVNGETLVVYNTHLTLGDSDTNAAELNQIFDEMKKDQYTLMLGDLNIRAEILETYMDHKSFMCLNGGLDFSTVLYSFNSQNPSSSIDNIIVKRGGLEYYWNHETGVGLETDKLPDISDHNPVYTWVKIPE